MPHRRSVVFDVMVKEAYYRRIPSYDRFPTDGVECPLGMELKHCDEAKVPIRSQSPTKPRRFRSIPGAGRKRRRKLLGLAARPEQIQHSSKGEELKRKREEEEEEYEPKVKRRTTEEEKNETQPPEKKEGEAELKRQEKEKDSQAHLLGKTEDDDEEELRAILASREWSGCSCKDRCCEDTCECLQAGIYCCHTRFPGGRSSCSCSSKRCSNIDPKLRGSWRRKQDHFTEVMTRMLQEECFGEEEEEGAFPSPGRGEEDNNENCDYTPVILDDNEDYSCIL